MILDIFSTLKDFTMLCFCDSMKGITRINEKVVTLQTH